MVKRVGVAEDVVRRLPVGVFIGVAEPRHPERTREESAETAAEVELPVGT